MQLSLYMVLLRGAERDCTSNATTGFRHSQALRVAFSGCSLHRQQFFYERWFKLETISRRFAAEEYQPKRFLRVSKQAQRLSVARKVKLTRAMEFRGAPPESNGNRHNENVGQDVASLPTQQKNAAHSDSTDVQPSAVQDSVKPGDDGPQFEPRQEHQEKPAPRCIDLSRLQALCLYIT